MLAGAAKKEIANVTFRQYELNHISSTYAKNFDIVMCFEPLEHIGNYRNAFENIYLSAKPEGHIIISVPNELGFPGIVKFIGRKILRREVYATFFARSNRDEISYILALISGGDIEVFRSPSAEHWGPHLGFSFKNFEAYLDKKYLRKKSRALDQTEKSFLGFNRIYVFRKTAIS